MSTHSWVQTPLCKMNSLSLSLALAISSVLKRAQKHLGRYTPHTLTHSIRLQALSPSLPYTNICSHWHIAMHSSFAHTSPCCVQRKDFWAPQQRRRSMQKSADSHLFVKWTFKFVKTFRIWKRNYEWEVKFEAVSFLVDNVHFCWIEKEFVYLQNREWTITILRQTIQVRITNSRPIFIRVIVIL